MALTLRIVADAGNESVGQVLLRNHQFEVPPLEVVAGTPPSLKTGGVKNSGDSILDGYCFFLTGKFQVQKRPNLIPETRPCFFKLLKIA